MTGPPPDRWRCRNTECATYGLWLPEPDVFQAHGRLYHEHHPQGRLLPPAAGSSVVRQLPGTREPDYLLPCGPVEHVQGPCRLQLRRSKGWRLADHGHRPVACTRPGRYGNPWRVTHGDHHGWWWVTDAEGRTYSRHPMRHQAVAVAVERFGDTIRGPEWADRLAELAGRDLACHCHLDDQCHVDVLLERANRRTAPDSAVAR